MARNAATYDEDFFAWTQEQARLLREGDLASIDVENVAEEIESMGRSDRRQLSSRLTVLLTHLLKWEHQPELRSNGWLATIVEQRRQIAMLVEESPSLVGTRDAALPRSYADARGDAALETGIAVETFPAACPYTIEQVTNPNFLPGQAG